MNVSRSTFLTVAAAAGWVRRDGVGSDHEELHTINNALSRAGRGREWLQLHAG